MPYTINFYFNVKETKKIAVETMKSSTKKNL